MGCFTCDTRLHISSLTTRLLTSSLRNEASHINLHVRSFTNQAYQTRLHLSSFTHGALNPRHTNQPTIKIRNTTQFMFPPHNTPSLLPSHVFTHSYLPVSCSSLDYTLSVLFSFSVDTIETKGLCTVVCERVKLLLICLF